MLSLSILRQIYCTLHSFRRRCSFVHIDKWRLGESQSSTACRGGGKGQSVVLSACPAASQEGVWGRGGAVGGAVAADYVQVCVIYCWITAAVTSGALVQRFAATVPFLVQAALAALHHVNEVGQRLLLVHRDISEVATHRLKQEKKRPVYHMIRVVQLTLVTLPKMSCDGISQSILFLPLL